MGTYILTSAFENGFAPVKEQFCSLITKRDRFALVASEFELRHDKTDRYFGVFLDYFAAIGIEFGDAKVVDGRMSPEVAQRTVAEADVVWLAGGMTPVQFGYFKKYGLVDALRAFDGVMIGMSAGSINMGKISVTDEFEDGRYHAYEGVGVVDCTVDPHFDPSRVSPELLELSKDFPIYGLCDDGAIVVAGGETRFVGEMYEIKGGSVRRLDV